MNAYETLTEIQNELKVPKDNYNSNGKYKYRSCEDILEALKPLLKKYKATVFMSDEICMIGESSYIKSNANFVVGDVTIHNSAYAKEDCAGGFMKGSQLTGSASSYARKYALNGLFLIDDTKDADTDEYQAEIGNNKQEGGGKENKKVTEAQLTRMYTIAKNKGYTKNDINRSVQKKGKQSAKDLTMAEYDEIVKGIENAPVRKGVN